MRYLSLVVLLALAACGQRPPADQSMSSASGVHTVSYVVYFDWDSAELTEQTKEVLRLSLTDLHNMPVYHIASNGHADTSGGDAYNMSLSERRAASVARWLKEAGIDEKQIEVYAFGESNPAKQTGDNVREAANRRVEIVIE